MRRAFLFELGVRNEELGIVDAAHGHLYGASRGALPDKGRSYFCKINRNLQVQSTKY